MKPKRRLRNLASSDRVGRHARKLAWTRSKAEIKRSWLLLVLVIVFPFLFYFASIPFLRGVSRWFVFGSVTITGPFLALGLVLLFSGATTPIMGIFGEEWTAQQFRTMKRKGWRLVNGLQLRPHRDIDHVVVCPSGVFVVETKWSSDSWPKEGDRDSFNKIILKKAVEQVTENREDFSSHFKSELNGVLVKAVCVLWTANPSETLEEIQSANDVVIVPGQKLRTWMTTLDSSFLNEHQVESITAAVVGHASKRDAYDVKRGVIAQDSWRQIIAERFLPGTTGGLVAFYGSLTVSRFSGRWQWSLAVPVIFFVVGVIALRLTAIRNRTNRWLRAAFIGWITASSVVAFLYLGILAHYLLR
jgi:hypothetical protein